jgi:hypothetical protein
MLEPVEICYTFSGHLAGYTYIAICLIVKENVAAKVSQKCLLTLNWGIDFIWDAKPYMECCTKKEISGIMCLLAGVSKLKGIRKGWDKWICLLCLGLEVSKHIAELNRNLKFYNEMFKYNMSIWRSKWQIWKY